MFTTTVQKLKSTVALLFAFIPIAILTGCEGTSSPLAPNLQAPAPTHYVPPQQTPTLGPSSGSGSGSADVALGEDEQLDEIDGDDNEAVSTKPAVKKPKTKE